MPCRKLQAIAMLCIMDSQFINTIIQLLLFFVPSAGISSYAIYRTLRLASQMRVAPMTAPSAHGGSGTNNTTDQASLKRAVRLILLVSGSFWATYLPGYMLRALIHNRYTWEQLNFRSNPYVSVFYRFLMFALCHFSSMLNPLIYLFTHRNLRSAARILLRLETNFPTDSDNTNVTEAQT